MLWTASEYAAVAGVTVRGAQKRLARWLANGRVRVVREDLPALGPGEPPRSRYLLDVASWRAATGIAA